MGSLSDHLLGYLTAARKSREKHRTVFLSTLRAELRDREIELQRDLSDEEALAVVRRGIRQRRDVLAQCEAAGREDRAQRERQEIAWLEALLPPGVAADEIRAAAQAAIVAGTTEVGPLMKQLMAAFKGRADGKVVNQIAREELAKTA